MAIVLVSIGSPLRADSDPDELTSSCSGGPGGGGFGVTVRAGGEFVRWHTPSFHEEPEEVPMRSDPELSAALFEQAAEIDFDRIAHDAKGDVTCTLSLRQSVDIHAVSWPMGEAVAVPRVREIAKRIRALVDDPNNTPPPGDGEPD